MSYGAVDIGEAELPTSVAIDQSLMIEAQQMQDGGVKTVDVHAVFNSVIAKLVGSAVDHPPFDPAPSHPDGIPVRVVVPAIVLGKGVRPNSPPQITSVSSSRGEYSYEELLNAPI